MVVDMMQVKGTSHDDTQHVISFSFQEICGSWVCIWGNLSTTETFVVTVIWRDIYSWCVVLTWRAMSSTEWVYWNTPPTLSVVVPWSMASRSSVLIAAEDCHRNSTISPSDAFPQGLVWPSCIGSVGCISGVRMAGAFIPNMMQRQIDILISQGCLGQSGRPDRWGYQCWAPHDKLPCEPAHSKDLQQLTFGSSERIQQHLGSSVSD